ncbi:MAG: hypothetical protein ACD_13C00093G0025 [uncultured bacterium]|nr:MAG: hypothetical protein ACD_13C00093G0025 [uncultured bacterium]
MPIASIKPKLSQLPTPRYKRIAKRDSDKEEIKPLLELAKSKENVNKRVIKKMMKKRGIAPKVFGLTK